MSSSAMCFYLYPIYYCQALIPHIPGKYREWLHNLFGSPLRKHHYRPSWPGWSRLARSPTVRSTAATGCEKGYRVIDPLRDITEHDVAICSL